MRIKISAGYDKSENLVERLIKQFGTPEINFRKLEFVYDDSYDVIIFFNYVNEPIVSGKKAYVFPHEPSWTGSHQKHFEDNTTVFGFDRKLYSGNFIESVAHTFYGGRGPWVDKLDFWNYNTLISTEFEKIKDISCSITNLNTNHGNGCLYPERYRLLNFLKSKFDFDYFDGGISPLRKDALIDYRFNISIENSHEDNWITEKFYDCVLTETIPIYFGCKNIKEIYPEDGYILIDDINDLNSIEKLITFVKNNSKELYEEKINGLKKIKTRYFSDNNILNKIIDLNK